MFKFITKQFLYGRFYLWLKPRLSGIFLSIILLILVFYIHSEYLNYIEFKSKYLDLKPENQKSYIGLSFVLKNFFILSIVIGYLYFYKTMNKTEKSISKTQEVLKEDVQKNERASSLEEFMSDEEIDR
tara:strand:+ start:267 stop:650 length:384 start_codon:yes stop_codon:yes gene_type:complete